jgi:hypothetical protein
MTRREETPVKWDAFISHAEESCDYWCSDGARRIHVEVKGTTATDGIFGTS